MKYLPRLVPYKLDEYGWFVDGDLRKWFPDLDDNYEITEAIIKAKVYVGKKDDPESCCSYFGFKSEHAAWAFSVRLRQFIVQREQERLARLLDMTPDQEHEAMKEEYGNR